MQAHSPTSSSSVGTPYLSCHGGGGGGHRHKDTLLHILRFPSLSLGDSLSMASIGIPRRRRRRSATTSSSTNKTNAIPLKPSSFHKSLSKSFTVAAAASSSSSSPSTPQPDDDQVTFFFFLYLQFITLGGVNLLILGFGFIGGPEQGPQFPEAMEEILEGGRSLLVVRGQNPSPTSAGCRFCTYSGHHWHQRRLQLSWPRLLQCSSQ